MPARNITIANNLVTSDREVINLDLGMWEHFTVEGNLFHSSHEKGKMGWDLPEGGYHFADPKMVERGEISTISHQSPAVDAAMGDYPSVTQDIHGQLRTGRKDIGAVELSASSAWNAPLTAEDVGPLAK